MVNIRSDVYEFLSRQAQKGNIVFDDIIRPVSRLKVTELLDSLKVYQDQLLPIERKELAFFQKEFGSSFITKNWSNSDTPKFLKKDSNGRLRMLFVEKEKFKLNIDPEIEVGYLNSDTQSVKKISRGINAWATWGKHWGLQFSYAEATESGSGLNPDKVFTPQQGIILNTPFTGKSFNYNQTKANLYYSWKKGVISVGQDNLLWGYGENGRQVLSDKAPVFPYVRLSLDILKWLRFDYAHAFLASNVIDSNQTYFTGNTVFGGEHIIYRPKFMATNTLIFKPVKGLDLAFGESVIYSENVQFGYLMPFFYLKGYDQYSSGGRAQAGANSQLFIQVSSRNQIKNTHLYGSLFIDEISLSNISNPQKSRNQIGYQIGGSITDLIIPYFTLQAEYARINPFVYANLNPAQTYTSNSQVMGDWMGNNADRWMVSAKYSPIPRLRLLARYQYIRKGSAGTPEQQYDMNNPQPPFLFGLQRNEAEFLFRANYELINNVYFMGSFGITSRQLAPSFSTQNFQSISAGMAITL
jgi:hypothetical protein